MKFYSLILLLALSSSPLLADTQFTMQSNQQGAPTDVYISNGKLYTSAEGMKIIINPGAEEMTIIDDAKKEYMLLDQEFFDQIGGMMSMMQEMVSQLPPGMLDNLPPEQRDAIMGQLGGGKTPANEKSKAAIKKSGGGKKVNNIQCEFYTITDSEGGSSTACVASQKSAGMNDADYATMMSVSEFGRAMVEQMAESMPGIADNIDISGMASMELPGIPVEVINEEFSTTITSITEKSLDLSEYSTTNYTRADLSAMMGQ